MKFLGSYIVLFTFLFCSCKDETTNCTVEQVEGIIRELPEVKAKHNWVDSISGHTRSLTFVTTKEEMEERSWYVVKVGDSDTFEIYYTFYVHKKNCQQIAIVDPVTGMIPNLAKWRSQNASDAKQQALSALRQANQHENEESRPCYQAYGGDDCNCKRVSNSMEEGFIDECVFENLSLSDIYQRYLTKDSEDIKYLLSYLPKHDTTYKSQSVYVEYIGTSTDSVKAVLNYPGGVTTLAVSTKGDQPKLRICISPD